MNVVVDHVCRDVTMPVIARMATPEITMASAFP